MSALFGVRMLAIAPIEFRIATATFTGDETKASSIVASLGVFVTIA
jgi:hypothetical protein